MSLPDAQVGDGADGSAATDSGTVDAGLHGGEDAGIDGGSNTGADGGADAGALDPGLRDAGPDASTRDGGEDADAGDAGVSGDDDAGRPWAWASDPRVDASVYEEEDPGIIESPGSDAPMPRPCSVLVDVAAAASNPAFAATSADLTAWSTHQGNADHDGWVPITLDVGRFEERWRFQDFGRELFDVAVDRGLVALSAGKPDNFGRPGHVLHTLSLASGHIRWTRNAVLEYDSVSPPALADGVVYAQVGAQSGAYLEAMDALDGATLWRAPFESQWPRFLAPTIEGDAVAVGGGQYGGMYLYDRASGEERWFVGTEQVDRFTPTLRSHDVFALTKTTLRVVDRSTGQVTQKIKHPTLRDDHEPDSVPVAARPDLLVAVRDKHLFTFDLAAASVGWTVAGAFVGQPVVARGVLYVANGSALEARAPETGALLWAWASPNGALGRRIVVTDNLAFVTTPSSTHAIDLATHTSIWSYAAAGTLAMGQGTLLIAGKTELTAVDLLGDLDADGLPDWWELHHGGSDVNPREDSDADTLDNAAEWALDTLPGCADTDGDSALDGIEAELGLSANDPDSDDDSLTDGAELALHDTNPKLRDSDHDGVDDDLEVRAGLNPNDPVSALGDQDGDGYFDAHEALARTNPFDAASRPVATDWAMHQGNARHDGYQPSYLDPARFALRWSYTLDDDIRGVALGDRHVVLTTGHTTQVFAADDGRLRWRKSVRQYREYSWSHVEHSAPSLYRGDVYVHSAESLSATLWVYNARTGALRQRSVHGTQESSYLAPTLYGGRAHMNAGYYGGVVARDAITGIDAWTADAPMEGPWEPAVAGEQVWLVKGGLRAFDRSGGAEQSVHRTKLPSTTPVLDRRGRAFFGGPKLLSVDLASGHESWRAEHGPMGSDGEPSVGNTRVYSVKGGALQVHHAQHGRLLWQWQPEGEPLTSNVVVTARHVFVASEQATYAVDLSTQAAVMRHPFGGHLALGGEQALAIFAGPRIDVLSLEGDVDGDGIAEWWERAQGEDIEPEDDPDGDGLSELEEYRNETDPLDADSDDDGLSDGDEVALETDPLAADSDGDSLSDAREVNVRGTDPRRSDGDGDGLLDVVELAVGLDPNDPDDAPADLDADGFTNRHEALAGSALRDATSRPALHAWSMFRGDPGHTSFQPVMLEPARYTQTWAQTRTNLLPSVSGYVAVDRDRVYLSAEGRVAALSLRDGAEVWSFATGATPSAPSLAEGLVYVQGNAQGKTSVWAFDRESGQQVFQTLYSSSGGYYRAPAIANGVLVAPGGDSSGTIALDAGEGSILWYLPTGARDRIVPALDDERAYWLSWELRALDVTSGATAFSITPSERRENPTTPVLTPSGLLVAGEHNNLVAFSAETGAERGHVPSMGRPFGMPAVARGRIYAVRSGLLEVLDEATGRRLWTWQPEEEALVPERLLITASHVLIGGPTTTYAVDLATREQVWSHPVAGDLAMSAEGVLVIHDGVRVTVLHPQP